MARVVLLWLLDLIRLAEAPSRETAGVPSNIAVAGDAIVLVAFGKHFRVHVEEVA